MSSAEEIQLFRDMVLRFLEQEIIPHYDEWEANHHTPKNVWQTLGQAGLLLVDLPERYGSAGASFEIAQMIQEEMCRLGLHGLATGYNIHANIVAPYIENIGTEEQKQRWLPAMVSGDVLTALAMNEPGSGSDVAAMRSGGGKRGQGEGGGPWECGIGRRGGLGGGGR